jgi:SHS2 domain-containing protein
MSALRTHGSPLLPGVRALDHTADVGLDLEAGTLEALFRAAAAGLALLIRGADVAAAVAPAAMNPPGPEAAAHWVELDGQAADPALLLAAWLRDLVYLHATTGATYDDAVFDELDEHAYRARVRLVPERAPPAREIKGVTYHGLEAGRDGGVWRATVIFDV